MPVATPPTPSASSPPLSHTSAVDAASGTTTTMTSTSPSLALDPGVSPPAGPNDATSKLAEAIDDFLGDLKKKFKVVSDEILTKLDDMADRCDRLEQDMLLRDATSMEREGIGGKAPTGSTTGSA